MSFRPTPAKGRGGRVGNPGYIESGFSLLREGRPAHFLEKRPVAQGGDYFTQEAPERLCQQRISSSALMNTSRNLPGFGPGDFQVRNGATEYLTLRKNRMPQSVGLSTDVNSRRMKSRTAAPSCPIETKTRSAGKMFPA